MLANTALAGILLSSVALVGCAATPKTDCGVNWSTLGRCYAAPPVAAAEPAPEPAVAEPALPAVPAQRAVVIKKDKIEILEKVQFEYNSARLVEDSTGILDEVAQVLIDNPEITRVRVEGHTDSTGRASYNRKLSKKRAAAVRTYLIDRGVAG